MDERIKGHLMRLNRYYLQLVDIRRISCEDFIGDDIHRAAAERVLQTAIESFLNIGNRLISLLRAAFLKISGAKLEIFTLQTTNNGQHTRY